MPPAKDAFDAGQKQAKAGHDAAHQSKRSASGKAGGFSTSALANDSDDEAWGHDDDHDDDDLPGRFGRSTARGWSMAANLCADFRALPESSHASVTLPVGFVLKGGDGEPLLEEQEDGSNALVLPESSALSLSLPCSPWKLQQDGRLHSWTILMAMRLDRLPASASIPILSGGAHVDHKVSTIQIFKNGGVGAHTPPAPMPKHAAWCTTCSVVPHKTTSYTRTE